MLHSLLSELFTFLGLYGYARLHRYRELEEGEELKEMTDRYILTKGMLIPDAEIGAPTVLQQYYRTDRRETDTSWRRRAVRDGMAKWCDRENETVALLNGASKHLSINGEFTDAAYVAGKADNVLQEKMLAEDMSFRLESIDYSMPEMLREQDRFFEEYSEKIRKLFDKR